MGPAEEEEGGVMPRPGRGLGRVAAPAALLMVALARDAAAQAPPPPGAQASPGATPAQVATPPAGATPAQVAASSTDRRTASLGWARLAGAKGCSGGATMARAVESILRREALVPASRADLLIEARVEKVPGRPRFRAVIEVVGTDGAVIGARTIESATADCHRLDEPVALAIALMIDPEAVTRPISTEPPAPPPPMVAVVRDALFVPVPVPIAAPLPTPPPAPPIDEGPWLSFALGPSVGFGIVPGAAPGVRASVEVGPPADRGGGVSWGPSSIRAGFAAYGGSEDLQGPGPGDDATLAVDAILPRLELCPTTMWLRTRAALGACGALDVGVLGWTGQGFDSAVRLGTEAFVAVGPTLHGRLVVVGPLAVELRGAAVVPLTRDRFVFGQGGGATGLAHQASVVAGTLDLGAHVGF
jgi:hypothetical protein